ncbi:MAG: hypothetical protein QOE58_2665 [Actinomycetota bacterium]|nr:hypothetical protein [Actinomycetota bacterium]
MPSIDPDDLANDEASELVVDASGSRDRGGSLRDTQEESGDEEGLTDAYDMDDREARELGVQLDDRDEPEPGLD